MEQFWTKDKITRYEEAQRVVMAKLRIIDEKYCEKEGHHYIRFMESRLKTEDSIQSKLIRKGVDNKSKKPVEVLIRDVAGVRCVCYDINQVYKFVKAIKKDEELKVIKQKDYIKNPKSSGYQSYHMIIQIEGVLVELQLRTLLMDAWSSMETIVAYKNTENISDSLKHEIKSLCKACRKVDKEIYKVLKQK